MENVLYQTVKPYLSTQLNFDINIYTKLNCLFCYKTQYLQDKSSDKSNIKLHIKLHIEVQLGRKTRLQLSDCVSVRSDNYGCEGFLIIIR